MDVAIVKTKLSYILHLNGVNGVTSMQRAENIQDLVMRRVDYLRRKHPDISISYFILGSPCGEYGVVLYTEYNFNPMGFEFIESKTSWRRTEAIIDYNELTGEGYCVLVFVPQSVMGEVAETMRERKGRENVRLFPMERLVTVLGT
jgi:hypothetical protein